MGNLYRQWKKCVGKQIPYRHTVWEETDIVEFADSAFMFALFFNGDGSVEIIVSADCSESHADGVLGMYDSTVTTCLDIPAAQLKDIPDIQRVVTAFLALYNDTVKMIVSRGVMVRKWKLWQQLYLLWRSMGVNNTWRAIGRNELVSRNNRGVVTRIRFDRNDEKAEISVSGTVSRRNIKRARNVVERISPNGQCRTDSFAGSHVLSYTENYWVCQDLDILKEHLESHTQVFNAVWEVIEFSPQKG